MLEAFLSRMLEISQVAVVFKSIKNEILAFFESLSLSLPERPRLIDFENRVIEELEKEIDVRQRFTGIDVLKMIHVFRLEMSDSCYEKILCLGKLSLSEEKKIISFSSNDRSFRIKEPTPEIIIEFMTTICDTLHEFKTFVELANGFQQWRKRKFWGPVDHHSFVNLFTKLTERISEAVPFYHCLNLQKKIDNKEIIDGPYLMKLRTYFINVDLADWPHEDIVISFSAPSNCFDAFREKLLEIRIIKEEIFETEEVESSNSKRQRESLEDEPLMAKKAKIDNQSQSNSPHQQQNLDTLDASLDQCGSSIDADLPGPSTSENIISEENISNNILMTVVPYFCHFDDHDYLQYKVDFIQEQQSTLDEHPSKPYFCYLDDHDYFPSSAGFPREQQNVKSVSPEQQVESTSTLDEHPSRVSNPVDEIGEGCTLEMINDHPNGSNIDFLEETEILQAGQSSPHMNEDREPLSSTQEQPIVSVALSILPKSLPISTIQGQTLRDAPLRPVHQSVVMTTQKQGEICKKEQLNKFLELINQMVAAFQKNTNSIEYIVSDACNKLEGLKLTTRPWISLLKRASSLLLNGRQHKFVDLDKRILIHFAQYEPLHESIIAELISTERMDDFELDRQERITYYRSGSWWLGEKSNVHQSFKFFWKNTTPLQRELLILLADLSTRRSSIMSRKEIIDEFRKNNADIKDYGISQELMKLLPNIRLALQYSVKTRVQMIFLTQSELNGNFKSMVPKFTSSTRRQPNVSSSGQLRNTITPNSFDGSRSTTRQRQWTLPLLTANKFQRRTLPDAASVPVQERNVFANRQAPTHTMAEKPSNQDIPLPIKLMTPVDLKINVLRGLVCSVVSRKAILKIVLSAIRQQQRILMPSELDGFKKFEETVEELWRKTRSHERITSRALTESLLETLEKAQGHAENKKNTGHGSIHIWKILGFLKSVARLIPCVAIPTLLDKHLNVDKFNVIPIETALEAFHNELFKQKQPINCRNNSTYRFLVGKIPIVLLMC
ncbi:hypothetical protein GCK72_020220 [Caenorhabditis remanei]|uniref:SPK domain-containing protein n=1 Tax=Caenorhabditis remanei TaxID=31234 RepID=A0A6A5GG61_CAERE|nr:hypothetical protein GCK72_020220 [Caenorhabditis remanei]KAF1753663.1 hypothetical protein GCK72_020220 [Caenorhabditis remanei]